MLNNETFVLLLVVKSISRFLHLLPRKIKIKLGYLLGWLWFDFFKIRRQLIDRNIQIVYPQMPPEQRLQLARSALLNMGRNFIESLMIPSFTDKYISDHVTFQGLENLENAKVKEKGILLMSVHIGSVDLGTVSLAQLGLKVHLLSKEFNSEWLNKIWFGIRKEKGIHFIKPHGTRSSFAILRALKRQECVMFVIDQFMGRPHGITASFFGKETGTPYGLALFHIKTQTPVIPVYTYRGADGKTYVRFEPEIMLENRPTRDENIRHMVEIYNRVVESLVLRHPEQWMWVHDRWKRKI